MVLVGIVAVFGTGLAGRDSGPRCVLSDLAADHGIRHPVLLGGAHDHDELPFHARTQGRRRPVPHGVYPCAGARCRAAEDVEDQGQRHRSNRDHRAVRHRRGALHAGRDGCTGNRHRVFRGPDRRLSQVRQQDLERLATAVHECGSRAGGRRMVAGRVQGAGD